MNDNFNKMSEATDIITNKNIVKHNDFYNQKGFKGNFKRFFSFAGRIGRITFCLRLLVLFISLVAIYSVDVFIINNIFLHGIAAIIIILLIIAFTIIWTVLSFVSTLSLAARRLHDFNFNARGVMLFIIFAVIAMFLGFKAAIFWLVPVIVFLVLALIPGTKGKNRYGFRNLKAMLSEFD